MNDLTYGRLDQFLRSLGFSVHITPRGGKAYTHESGALLAFPAFPDEKPVMPHHLVVSCVTLDQWGFPVPAELAEPAQQAGWCSRGERTTNGLTYGRLDQLLRSLEFSVRLSPRGGKWYSHETGALVAVPSFPDDKPVMPHHLLAAQIALDGFGIPISTDLGPVNQRVG